MAWCKNFEVSIVLHDKHRRKGHGVVGMLDVISKLWQHKEGRVSLSNTVMYM